jgi:hypothetical protein
MIDIAAVSKRLRSILSADADRLFEHMLAMTEQDIREGWRVFYAREIWFKELLPPPLINELGRRYMVERLREDIWLRPGEDRSDYQSEFLRQFLAEPKSREGYRNYLDVGTVTIEDRKDPFVLDKVADAVATQQLEEAHRHMWYETTVNALKWHVEVSQRGTLTAPPLGISDDGDEPVRRPAVPLESDGAYWFAFYRVGWHMLTYPEDHAAKVLPDLHLEWMAHIAPDFPYAPQLSTVKRLIFVQQGDSELAWALMIDKTSNSPDFRYPPQLILIDRQQKKKLKDEHIIFVNAIRRWYPSYASTRRGMEVELLFHVPRCRKLIAIYQPYIEQAIEK